MYQALYRKYRPNNFDEIVGQEFVINTLKNAIKFNKISHAYMFFGPRGIGKTSIAKILSRSVNCLENVDGNPCEKCENCLNSKTSVDIIEIDAASNNGVDEIREIKNNVNIVPSELKYKVYIIDEVHMLTSSAFNALLKTLEEPPKHVIFILATTDPQKVSDTIISRCQCYSFKRISVDSIVKKLKEVVEKEKIKVEDSVLNKIAEYSDGGLRDSLGLLDKLSSYKNELITLDDFYEINDMVSLDEILSFINYIIDSDFENVIAKIKKYSNNGKNLIEIIKQMIQVLRDDIIELYLKDNKSDIENKIKLLNILIEKMFDIKKSGNPKIYIEVMLLNFMKNDKIISREIISKEIKAPNETKKSENLIEKNDIIDDNINLTDSSSDFTYSTQNIAADEVKNNVRNSNIDEIIDIRINNIFSGASKDEKNADISKFKMLNDYIYNSDYGYLVTELLNANLRVSSNYGIIISYEYDSVVDQNILILDKLEKTYNELTSSNKKIAIISDEKWEILRKEYVNNIKNGIKYDIIEEPDYVEFTLSDNSDNIIENKQESPLDLFKDIVEVK